MHLRFIVALALTVQASGVSARNIVLSNDDGLTSNVLALYRALKAQGDDVVVSVPCLNQSGMGAAAYFMKPLGPLRADCRNGAARIGDPGAGAMTRADLPPDFFYVDGTSVMAMLYAIDLVATARWGKAPDLVLSDPNESPNTGPIVLNSGTVSNAQYALSRGIPAIALSAGSDTIGDAGLANPKSLAVAQLAVRLIESLETAAPGQPLLPAGAALNVNFPVRLEGARWKLARIGSYSRYDVRFVPDLGKALPSAPAALRGAPGMAIDVTRGSRPRRDQADDEAAVNRDHFTVSVMQLAYDQALRVRKTIKRRLRGLLKR